MSRHLHVAPEVAKAIPAFHIAQMESQVDDHDNVCGVCLSFIDTNVVNLYAAYDPAEGGMWDIRMAHPDCHDSTVVTEPGLRELKKRQMLQKSVEGGFDLNMVMVLRRDAQPRAVLLQEFHWLIGRRDDDDPLQMAADAFGLSPVSGDLPTVTGLPTSKVWLRPVAADGLELVHEHGADQIDPYPEWREVAIADRQALLILGRGMHLDRPEPETISRGLRTQPCWGAIVPVESGKKPPPSPRRRGRGRRRQ